MKNKICRILAIGVPSLLLANVVLAAPSSEDVAKQAAVLKQQESRMSEKQAQADAQRRTSKDFISLQEGQENLAKIQLPEETPSFFIEHMELKGEYAEKFYWAQEYLNQYANQRIGVQGINLLIAKLNEAFVDKGYVTTRVFVSEQDLSTGKLILSLQAGTIGKIYFKPETWGTWVNAFPVHHGDVLNIRDIEQGLEQMKRLASQDVDISIEPGEKDGESNIALKVSRSKNWHGVLSFDDSGAKDTGKLQATTSLSLDNLFSINDLFYLSFGKDANSEDTRKGTKSHSLYYSLPLGKETLTLSQSDYEYHQTVETALLPFLSSGKMTNTQIRVNHNYYRDQTRKSDIEIGVVQKKRRSYIDGTEIGVQRQKTTALELGVLQRQYFGESVMDLAMYYRKGVPWFSAQPGITDGMYEQPTTRYSMYTMDFNFATPLKFGNAKGKYNLNIRGQSTKDYLYSSEFFSIGGRYSVRGFDGEQSLSAENGMVIRNEFVFPIAAKHNFYAAIDYGKVQGPSAEYLTGSELAGGAIGFRGEAENIKYDVFVGWPIKKPDGFTTAPKTYGFQIVHQF
ncbi:ShlB/FhaC/HecB family hemolysin secretion/activation protein [Anaerosinus sp.]